MIRLRRHLTPRTWSETREGASAAAVAIGVCVILAFVALHGFNRVALGDGRVFSLDRDWSVPFVWTILLFAAGAWLWWRLAALRPGHRHVWLALSALCALLALEGAAQLHGRLETWAGYDLSLFVIQPLLAVLVLGLFALGRRQLEVPARRLLTAAAITLVLAQLMSMISGQVELGHAGVVLLSVLEESLEMLTGTLLVAAPLPFVLAARRAERRSTRAARERDTGPLSATRRVDPRSAAHTSAEARRRRIAEPADRR